MSVVHMVITAYKANVKYIILLTCNEMVFLLLVHCMALLLAIIVSLPKTLTFSVTCTVSGWVYSRAGPVPALLVVKIAKLVLVELTGYYDHATILIHRANMATNNCWGQHFAPSFVYLLLLLMTNCDVRVFTGRRVLKWRLTIGKLLLKHLANVYAIVAEFAGE